MANLDEIRWFGCLEPISFDRIRDVESRLGVRLPEGFVACVVRWHGGCPENLSFSYADPHDGQKISDSLGYFFSFREPLDHETKMRLAWEPFAWRELGIERSDSILDCVVDRPEFLEGGLVPFSSTGSGDLICLDYRGQSQAAEPSVALWRHEFLEDRPVVNLAGSFADFVNGLEQYDPEELLKSVAQGGMPEKA